MSELMSVYPVPITIETYYDDEMSAASAHILVFGKSVYSTGWIFSDDVRAMNMHVTKVVSDIAKNNFTISLSQLLED